MRNDFAALMREGALGPMLKEMNQTLVAVSDGAAVVEGKPEARFENSMGRIHGGYVAALIDTALGVAVHSKVPAGLLFGTIDLNVKFVRAITAVTGILTASGTVVHAGRTVLTAEAKVADKNGVLYAHGSGTFMVYPKQ